VHAATRGDRDGRASEADAAVRLDVIQPSADYYK
jgi:hypothetical protein